MSRMEISAGGVVYRFVGGGLQIQLIQDRYGKVSLAKGKREPGETPREAALREIREETGIEGRIIELVDIIRYQYENEKYGLVDKEVRYYLVEALGGELRAQQEEIRGVEWFSPEEALILHKKSGYENNHPILRSALTMLGLKF